MKIFGNEMSAKDVKKALGNQNKFIKRFGDDRNEKYYLKSEPNKTLENLGVSVLKSSDTPLDNLGEKPIIMGNIRMGFGHYRISMAMASAAHSMGYTPYWLDLNSFPDTTMTKIISRQDELYSLGSRLSQRFTLFNKLVWEPMNSEGFRKLSYNCSDQMTAELMTRVFSDIPKDIPIVATHAWVSQAAIHAGMENVVNAIPDNWPMALHLSEGAAHTIQTPSSYMGYKALRGMDKNRILNPMTKGSLFYTGHYIDHELVANLEADTAARLERIENGKPLRFMISVGGAGAQEDIFVAIIKTLMPYVRTQKAALFINYGDHSDMYEVLSKAIPELEGGSKYFEDAEGAKDFAERALNEEITGLHQFCNSDIFEAVYSTNRLMRACDVLVTKPSELSYYPVPKLMIKRVGGHEAWGAIRSAEVGDGTYEIQEIREINGMIRLMIEDPEILAFMNERITDAKNLGVYDGAYKVIELAEKLAEDK